MSERSYVRTQPSHLIIHGNKNSVLVKIDLSTGAVEFGQDYTAEETARVFWKSIGRSIATQPEARRIVEKHRQHVALSPGVGEEIQKYALAVCDDILSDLPL